MTAIIHLADTQHTEINTLLLIVLTILMIGRAIDRYFDGRK